MNKTKLIIAIAASTAILSGCATKQETGQLFGAVGGGVICNQLTKNSPDAIRLLATAGCAYAGSYLGGQIGKNLDAKDREALAKTTQEALDSSRSGTTTWTSKETGAKAELVIGNTFKETETKTVKRSVAVQPVSSMEKLDAPYLTLKAANVRSAPSTSGERLALLPAMTEFRAMGKTGDWILVGRRGTVVGYVHAPLVQSKALYEENLRKAEEARIAAQPVQVAEAPKPISGFCIGSCMEPLGARKAETPKPVQVKVTPALMLDSARPDTQPELVNIVAPPAEVATEVVAEQTCRSVSSTVTSADGKVESKDSKACRNLEMDLWANL